MSTILQVTVSILLATRPQHYIHTKMTIEGKPFELTCTCSHIKKIHVQVHVRLACCENVATVYTVLMGLLANV